MDRFGMMMGGALAATTLLALTPLGNDWEADKSREETPLEPGGQIEVAIDDQDVGMVKADQDLDVCFVVRNVAGKCLLLRQADFDARGEERQGRPTYRVSPGQKVAVTARLSAAELAPRGITHVLFATSDPKCPRLWLTVRGTVGPR